MFASIFAAVFVVAKAEAAGGFPEIMSGSTTVVTQDNKTYYGGLTGNYAVFNNDAGADYGFKKTLLTGAGNCLLSPACFLLGKGSDGTGTLGTGERLMTSRTTIDGQLVYELPALLFSGINVNGDVSSGLDYLKFWKSQNLNQNNGSNTDGSAWNLPSYTFNPKAQIVQTSAQFGLYKDKLLTLAGGGADPQPTLFTNTSGAELYLQGSSGVLETTNADSKKYPDGKVWTTGDLDIKPDVHLTYSGVGTIIVKGNFKLESGASIIPLDPNDKTSRLGIIVLKTTTTNGKCTFDGGSKLTAMTYCENTFKTDGNGEFTGSFVASGFTVDQNKSVLFDYDSTFDDHQPPGFRNLAIPGTTEIGNKQ